MSISIGNFNQSAAREFSTDGMNEIAHKNKYCKIKLM
jgi:hypothetical protein